MGFLCCDFEFKIHVTMETNIFRYLDHLNTFFLHVFQLMMTQ